MTYSDFFAFSVNLFSKHQRCTFSNILFTIISVSFIFFVQTVSDVSSANSMYSASSEMVGRSLMKIRKSRGPSVEPCGTPVVISFSVDLILFNWVSCFRFVK